jgi:thymidylate synthase (FAD)
MMELCKKVCPIAFEAFEEHVLCAQRFSKGEMAALKNLLNGKSAGLEGKALKRFEAKIGAVGTKVNQGKKSENKSGAET